MYNILYQAYQFRVENKFYDLPISVDSLIGYIRKQGYDIRTYTQARDIFAEHSYFAECSAYLDAFTFFSEREKSVYIKDELSQDERIFVLCHEIGHIYLRHTYFGLLGSSENETQKAVQEREADFFALCVIAPPCVLLAHHLYANSDIRRTTFLSEGKLSTLSELLDQEQHNKQRNDLERTLVRHCRIASQRNVKRLCIPGIVLAGIVAAAALFFVLRPAPKPDTAPSNMPASPVTEPATAPQAPAPESPVEFLVYVTKSGERYHTADCRYAANSSSLPISEAKEKGYTPCKVCEPDEALEKEK